MTHLTKLWLLLALMASNANAQVAIDAPIVLSGSSDEQRQVLGLPPSIISSDVLTGAVDQSGELTYGAALAISAQNWEVSIDGLQENLLQGTHVLIEVPLNTYGHVSLSINGTTAVPVILRGGSALNGEMYEAGSLLSLVFDGTSFQVMNGRAHSRRPCPSGMVQVNEATCIDINESSTLPFFDAMMVCIEQNKRMCSWGEWFNACHKLDELGLLNMTNNIEWTGNTANGNDAVRIVGNGSCNTAGTKYTYSEPRNYRCCLPR